jgi:hypothetical protein
MGVIGRFVVDSFFFECIVGAAWFLLRLGSLYEGAFGGSKYMCISKYAYILQLVNITSTSSIVTLVMATNRHLGGPERSSHADLSSPQTPNELWGSRDVLCLDSWPSYRSSPQSAVSVCAPTMSEMSLLCLVG